MAAAPSTGSGQLAGSCLMAGLLRVAADAEQAQHLAWTPARLKAWLAGAHQQQQQQSAQQAAHRQLVHLLPLVSSVAASQQQAQGEPSVSISQAGREAAVAPSASEPVAAEQHQRAADSDGGSLEAKVQQQAEQARKKWPWSAVQQHALPPKQAQPGDYTATQDIPAWDATALQAAAAAGAAMLGVSVEAAPAPEALAGAASSSSSSPAAKRSSSSAKRRQSSTPGGSAAAHAAEFGVLVLAHDKGMPAADAWQAWEAAHAGRVAVRVHLKAGVGSSGLPGGAWVTARQLSTAVKSEWGCFSLTQAILAAAAEVLQQHPSLQHLAIVSGQDVPVASVPRQLPAGLSLFGRFQFGRCFDAAAGRLAAQLLQEDLGMAQQEATAWGDALTFHHTWMVLNRQLLLALLSEQDAILRVAGVLNERFMQPDVAVAADEFMLGTAAVRFGFVRSVVHKKLHHYLIAARRTQQQQQQQQAMEAPPDGQPAAPKQSARQRGRREQPQPQEPKQQQQAARSSACQQPPPAKQRRVSGQQQVHVRSRLRGKPDGGGACSGRASAAAAVGAAAAAEHHASRPRRQRGARSCGASAASTCVHATAAAADVGACGDAASAVTPQQVSAGVRRRPRAVAGGSRVQGGGAQQRPDGAVSSSSSGADGAGASAGAAGGAAGVLLDCCPTLALFHPDEAATRHPHEWVSFTQPLLVDVASSRLGSHKLLLLQALGLAQPNGSLFFRKVGAMQGAAHRQLLACLQLLWRGRRLPPLVEELVLPQ